MASGDAAGKTLAELNEFIAKSGAVLATDLKGLLSNLTILAEGAVAKCIQSHDPTALVTELRDSLQRAEGLVEAFVAGVAADEASLASKEASDLKTELAGGADPDASKP